MHVNGILEAMNLNALKNAVFQVNHEMFRSRKLLIAQYDIQLRTNLCTRMNDFTSIYSHHLQPFI